MDAVPNYIPCPLRTNTGQSYVTWQWDIRKREKIILAMLKLIYGMLMIMDVVLCVVQEVENKKALDEAFICLTLARLVSDAPPNIVEFFGASILPHYSGSNRLQLFLELMPG